MSDKRFYFYLFIYFVSFLVCEFLTAWGRVGELSLVRVVGSSRRDERTDLAVWERV